MHSHLEEAFLPYRIKLTFIFLKSAVRHSQESVGAPYSLENRCASDPQSVNVCRKVVDRRRICKHVRKPLYGPRPLILDLTTCTVEASSSKHPHGHVAIATFSAANRPHGGRMPYECLATANSRAIGLTTQSLGRYIVSYFLL